MSDSSDTGNETGNNQDRTFLHRWSRRKRDQAKQSAEKVTAPALADTQPVVEPPDPQDVPEVDTLDENSEVSMFFSEQVSETLKRQALRKLFHMDKFNLCDGLDDYAEDYTLFEPLGTTLTAHQRLQEERETINRWVNEQEVPSAAENELPEQDTTLRADHNTESTDENQDVREQASVDQTEPKEG